MPANANSTAAPIADPEYHKAAMSYQEWRREPTTAQVMFGLQLPYRPPRSFIGKFFWRQRLWVEVTFALSMLEPWERLLVMVAFYFTLGLLLTGMTLYLPHHLAQTQARAAYYLFGRDGVSTYTSLGTSGADLIRSAVNTSLASIASAGSYTASLAGWGTQAAEL